MSRGMNRADRLREMERLYVQRGFTDIEMGERLGVDRTTVYKDRILLETEVDFIQDEQGRWYIDRTRYLSNVRVTLHQALALYLAARRVSRQTRINQPHVAEAVSKLAAALKQPMTQRLVQAADRILAQNAQPGRVKVLETITEAWVEQRKVMLIYQALGRTHSLAHTVHPYLIEPSLWSDSTYVIAYSERMDAVVPFKIERIERASLHMETFTILPDFDEQSLLQHAWGIWAGQGEPQQVRLYFRGARAVRRLKESVWHPLETYEEQPDGSCIWSAPIDEPQEMLPWVRGWGADVEVLEPAELREAILDNAYRLAAQYQIIRPTNSLDDRLLRLWGKTVKGNDQIYHPALYHLFDVGHVAQQLLSPEASPRWRRVLAAALNADSDTLHEWLPWVVAMHDIGKLTVPFQAQNETQKKRLEAEGFQFGRYSSLDGKNLRHTITGRLALNEVLDEMGADLPLFLQNAIEEMVSGHHGSYQLPNRQQRNDFRRVQEPEEWSRLRQRARQVLQSCFLQNAPAEWPTPENVSAAIAILNGFTILCDWLGSDENYFKPAPYQPLAEYLRRSQEQAQARVQDAGFFGPTQSRKNPAGFAELFPDMTPPRPLQRAIDTIPAGVLAQPVLAIIEAPTGEGKTEAALALARRIAAHSGSDEFYIALPTMATSNAMFARIQLHLRDRLGLPAGSVRLVHGQDFLVEDDLRIEPLGNGEQDTHPALTWFAPKKKALLAPFGVGTIDQAELTALNVRHNALRLIGLAGKVIILDEVHAYDAYMLTIIERMLHWLSILGSSVILLSATLPKATRRRLAEAYHKNILWPPAVPASESDYPSLLITGRAQPSPYQDFPPAFQPQRPLHLHHHEMGEEAWQQKAQWLVEAVRDGGCACWIANTVERAQQIYKAVEELCAAGDLEIATTLLHARFPLEERQQREMALQRRYGKERPDRPPRGIVVGTQVLEQSLDLDFDVMMSDLAPVDLFLQRAGRLHRHPGRLRPAAHQEPHLHINYERHESGALKIGADRFYTPYLLARTLEVLQDRPQLQLPADYRPLIEAVYHEEAPPPDSPLRPAWDALSAQRVKLEQEAKIRVTNAPDPEEPFCWGSKGEFQEDEESSAWVTAQTRWGQESVTVIPLLREGDIARLVPTEETINLNLPATRDEQLRLLQRAVRLSRPEVVAAFKTLSKQPPKEREKHLGRLFTQSALLQNCYPLWLEPAGDGVFISPDLPLSLDSVLGVIVHRKEQTL